MKQIKPEVVGYIQIEHDGESFNSSHILDKTELLEESHDDFQNTRVKSKFRPVYKKAP